MRSSFFFRTQIPLARSISNARYTFLTFRKFEPELFTKPGGFKEYVSEIERLLPVVLKEMREDCIAPRMQCGLQNYHPLNIYHPVHPRDPLLAAKQYGSVIWLTLHLAKEGMLIMDGPSPHLLTEQHYEAIVTIPALQHLVDHPAMKACAEKYPDLVKEPVPNRLVRDW